MRSCGTVRRGRLGGSLATVILVLVASRAVAGEVLSSGIAEMLTVHGQWDVSFAPTTLLPPLPGVAMDPAAPGWAMAEGGGALPGGDRPQFSARAFDWALQRSADAARFAEFLIGGGDSGWQFIVDPRGEDEYQLQWQARFR